MQALHPELLIPVHGDPIVNEEEADETLGDYRDACKYVHDQTVRFMNKGESTTNSSYFFKFGFVVSTFLFRRLSSRRHSLQSSASSFSFFQVSFARSSCHS